MRMELTLTESEAHMEITAQTDFEKETLNRVKESFNSILSGIEIMYPEYSAFGQKPIGAKVVLTFVNSKATLTCPN